MTWKRSDGLERLLQGIKKHLGLPTRYCVLSDIVKQTSARRRHPRWIVGFQSLAGTSKALRGDVGLDVDGLLRTGAGLRWALFFETGQGSAVTTTPPRELTCDAGRPATMGWQDHPQADRFLDDCKRCRGIYRAGGISQSGSALAGLPRGHGDGQKLHGLSMGLDICSTFPHGKSTRKHSTSSPCKSPPKLRRHISWPWPANSDPMLGYLTNFIS